MTVHVKKAKQPRMRLYDEYSQRLYLNATERDRFIKAAETFPDHIRIFGLTLLYTGCRLSEVRAVTKSAVQEGDNLLSVRSLKKRNTHHIREIPIPADLVSALITLTPATQSENAFTPDQKNILLWQNERGLLIDRITAYRWIKAIMRTAGIFGPQGCPKGLRHGYGIHAIRSGVPLNMLQKWMGHADIRTTAIYANAVGPEEMELAERMWR